MVHNHGPEEGRGLACPEYRSLDGQLRGECMLVLMAWSTTTRVEPEHVAEYLADGWTILTEFF